MITELIQFFTGVIIGWIVCFVICFCISPLDTIKFFEDGVKFYGDR